MVYNAFKVLFSPPHVRWTDENLNPKLLFFSAHEGAGLKTSLRLDISRGVRAYEKAS